MFEHNYVALTNVLRFQQQASPPDQKCHSSLQTIEAFLRFTTRFPFKIFSQSLGSALHVKLYKGKLGAPRNYEKCLYTDCADFLAFAQDVSEHPCLNSPKKAESFHRMVTLQDGLVKYAENIYFPSIFKILDQSKRFRGQLFLQRSWMIVSCQDGFSHSLSLILVAWAV